jgi:hypothetical protein
MGDSLATFNNIAYNLVLGSADDDIKVEQTENSNKNYGTDPTHTQVAKDALNHALNPLASELAKIAVKDVATRILDIWKTGSDPTGEELAKYVINKYTLHPIYQITDGLMNQLINGLLLTKNQYLDSKVQRCTNMLNR